MREGKKRLTGAVALCIVKAVMAKIIFFIEDDVPTLEVYGTALEKAGFSVEKIVLGKKALERVEQIGAEKEEKPDLILLDIILPDINGIEVLRAIKKNEATKGVPVFLLTNYTDQRPENKGYDVEYDRFVLKTSCTPSQLVQMVKSKLGD